MTNKTKKQKTNKTANKIFYNNKKARIYSLSIILVIIISITSYIIGKKYVIDIIDTRPQNSQHQSQDLQLIKSKSTNLTPTTPAYNNTTYKRLNPEKGTPQTQTNTTKSSSIHSKDTTTNATLSFQIIPEQITIQAKDIRSYKVINISENFFGISVTLNSTAANQLTQFTSENLHKPCQFVINKEILSIATIQSPLGATFILPVQGEKKLQKIISSLEN